MLAKRPNHAAVKDSLGATVLEKYLTIHCVHGGIDAASLLEPAASTK